MSINNTEQLFASKREFHKEKAKLPFEEKVAQIIELQKIDIEFNKHRRDRIPAYKRVWTLDKK